MRLSVCHVVNALGDTSMPGDLATTQASFEEFGRVGVLAWFDFEPFRRSERLDIVSLDMSDTLFLDRSQYRRVKAVLSEYDIVHTHHPHSGFYAKLIAKRLDKPVVHTEHNNHDGFTRKGRVANGVTNSLVDAVVFVSDSVRESVFDWERTLLSDSKISVINNGVDLDRLGGATTMGWSVHDAADIDPEAILVGTAGMLTEQKAHDILVDAVDRANADCDRPIELVISGDGPLREKLDVQIQQADYPNRLHLLGFLDEREQVYKMMDEIDIYAMPSRWEGFCVAALEGLALGNAGLFSNIPEFVEPFESVARFHELDDPADLAEQLLVLEEDDGLRGQLGTEARELVIDEYTLEETTAKYLESYRDLR